MSDSDRRDQPPDLIEVFRSIRQIVKGLQKKPDRASRSRRSLERPRAEPPAEDMDFDRYEAHLERLRAEPRPTLELDLDRLHGAGSERTQRRPESAEPALSATAGEHRYHHARIAALRGRLRDARAVREAYIVKELLDRPLAMRRRR